MTSPVRLSLDHALRGTFLHVRGAGACRRSVLRDRCEATRDAARFGLASNAALDALVAETAVNLRAATSNLRAPGTGARINAQLRFATPRPLPGTSIQPMLGACADRVSALQLTAVRSEFHALVERTSAIARATLFIL
jgi:hypothetical protein